MRPCRNSGSTAHDLDLFRGLEETQIMQQMIQHEKFARRMQAGARFGTYAIDPAHEALIKQRLRTHGDINALTPFNQPRNDFVQIGNGESIAGAEILDRPFWAGAITVPD